MPAQPHATAPLPMQRYWDLAVAPIQTQALAFALDLDLFSLLQQPHTADVVAVQLTLQTANTGVLLELLWSLGLLDKTDNADGTQPRYRSSDVATRHFTAQSPDSCIEAWRYRAQFLGRFSQQIGDMVRTGVPASAAEGVATPGNWAHAAQVQIGQEQRAISVPSVLDLFERLPSLPRAGRLLDLGGGPGWVAIGLAQRHPGLSGCVFDLPGPVAVAADNIRQAGLDARLSVIAGDLDHDDFGHGYDLVWCSSVLHFLSDPVATLRRIHAALAPGGTLLIGHAEIGTRAESSAAVLPYYTAMMLRGKYVPRSGDIAAALHASGFHDIQALGELPFPLAPLQLYSGRRA